MYFKLFMFFLLVINTSLFAQEVVVVKDSGFGDIDLVIKDSGFGDIDVVFKDMIHEKEIYNMYRDEIAGIDWYYRLHVRNEYVIKDLSTFTNVDLSFDINAQTYHPEEEDYNILDTSNFKIHND